MPVERHAGSPGEDGPVVATLVEDSADASPGGFAPISKALARDIEDDRPALYVEVRNAAFPDGAVRGQLED